jgi:hypothetical protein
MKVGTLDWLPGADALSCAELVNGESVSLKKYRKWGSGDLAADLLYRSGCYGFGSVVDAYQAAELLNTALYLEQKS